MEISPQREGDDREIAIGLSFEDYEEELNSKQELIDKLIEGLGNEDSSQKESTERLLQLRGIKEELGKMRTDAMKAGGMIEITDKIKEMMEQIEEAFKLKPVN
ncbi:MAG: hypothetical protein AAB355_00800 [Patescibacteria group bacterium]